MSGEPGQLVAPGETFWMTLTPAKLRRPNAMTAATMNRFMPLTGPRENATTTYFSCSLAKNHGPNPQPISRPQLESRGRQGRQRGDQSGLEVGRILIPKAIARTRRTVPALEYVHRFVSDPLRRSV